MNITGWWMVEEFMGVSETYTVVKSFSNTLDVTDGDYCLQRMKVQIITAIISYVIRVMDILGSSMITRNFILHCHFVEQVLVNLIFKFEYSFLPLKFAF